MRQTQTAVRFREDRYLPVKNVLPRTILDFLKVYYGLAQVNGKFFNDTQCPSSLSLYGDIALDAVLEWLRPKISRLVELDLTPTYAYTRVYSEGDTLAKHTDRASCEVALTISIRIPEGGTPSTIFLRPPNSEDKRVEMLEGDGCLYAGNEVQHWREAFGDDGYVQLFLFYIDTRGKFYPEHAYDKRRWLGDRRHQRLLTVDGVGTSIDSFLQHLKGISNPGPDPMADLVNRLLIEAAVGESPPAVTDAEIEEMVDEFRIGHGLFSGDATQRWLDDAGLTMNGLRALMEQRARTRKFRHGIITERVRPYFDARKRDFDVLTIFHVEAPSRADGRALANAAQSSGLWAAVNDGSRFARLNGRREIRYQHDLPDFADAGVNTVIGPEPFGKGFRVGQLLGRKAARFDRPTRAHIEDLLFLEWLSERRKKAKVEWHWA